MPRFGLSYAASPQGTGGCAIGIPLFSQKAFLFLVEMKFSVQKVKKLITLLYKRKIHLKKYFSIGIINGGKFQNRSLEHKAKELEK